MRPWRPLSWSVFSPGNAAADDLREADSAVNALHRSNSVDGFRGGTVDQPGAGIDDRSGKDREATNPTAAALGGKSQPVTGYFR